MYFENFENDTSNIIDGKKIADKIGTELKSRVEKLKELSITPGLAVIMVGDRTDTKTYVRMKRKKAEELGKKFQSRPRRNK